jgi:hypothetical protein
MGHIFLNLQHMKGTKVVNAKCQALWTSSFLPDPPPMNEVWEGLVIVTFSLRSE